MPLIGRILGSLGGGANPKIRGLVGLSFLVVGMPTTGKAEVEGLGSVSGSGTKVAS